jgi:T-complex protein 1 subunit delta
LNAYLIIFIAANTVYSYFKKSTSAAHPAAKLMASISQAQDIAAGDGTTLVVLFAGTFLTAAKSLLEKKLHSSLISDALKVTATESLAIIDKMKIPFASKEVFSPEEHEIHVESARTSLSSKFASNYSDTLAHPAVDPVLSILDGDHIDLNDIRIVQKVGETLDDSKLVDGIVFKHHIQRNAGNI